jgi:two-component system, OmpR family, response regulator ChvI
VTSRLSSNNKKKRILFVDDKPDLTSLLEIALERVGFDVDTFNDPSLVLKSFRPSLYDLIILDIIMPKIDGFELYEQIKKVDPGVKICFLTASEMHREELRKEKYCDLDKELFLQMPMPIKEIIREINKRLSST